MALEKQYLVGDGGKVDGGIDVQNVKQMLNDLRCGHCAFVVLNTEAQRDKAVELINSSHVQFRGNTLQAVACEDEPFSVLWANFDGASHGAKIWRMAQGMFKIFLALIFWATVFYGPYAWSIFVFDYTNGREPGVIYGLSFSLVVVVGNNIMYQVCSDVSDSIKFQTKDKRESCYMVLYTIACTLNVLLDFWTTYFTASVIMEELGFRTYFGVRLREVTSFTERFETYAMQRTLAENVFNYAFPSTYLLPFIIEPFATVLLPLQLGKSIVQSHPVIQGQDAEAWLAAAPMDMGRYADILLDVVLAVLIFYFPGGYTPSLFALMAGCHLGVRLPKVLGVSNCPRGLPLPRTPWGIPRGAPAPLDPPGGRQNYKI